MSSFKKLHEKWRKNREEARKNAALVKQRLLKEGTLVFKKYGIEMAVIFGSLAEERHTPTSDIDLLVRYLTNDKFYDFKRELEDTIGGPIDLYTDKDDTMFVNKIISRGEVIYEI